MSSSFESSSIEAVSPAARDYFSPALGYDKDARQLVASFCTLDDLIVCQVASRLFKANFIDAGRGSLSECIDVKVMNGLPVSGAPKDFRELIKKLEVALRAKG